MQSTSSQSAQQPTQNTPAATKSAPASSSPAPAAQPKLTLKSIAALLCKLDEQRILYVLKKMPPHLLARALDQLLQNGSIPVGGTESEGEGDGAGSQPDLLEKRDAERTETDHIGKIIYNNLMSVTDCTITNLSATGCLITIGSTLGVPECFTLQIGNGGTKRECKIIWRKHYEMGVKFLT